MISPMYPSKTDPVYGTFVKTYMDYFEKNNQQGVTKLICIRGRSKSLWVKAAKYLWFYLSALFHLMFIKYDVIYVHTISTSIPPLRFATLFKRLNVVYNVHGTDVITTDSTGEHLKHIAAPLLANAKLIVAPSDFFKGIVKESFPGIKEKNIFVSPSGGVDLEIFKPVSRQSNTELVLGYVSRIDKGKGWDVFVTMISHLLKKGVNVRGVIAGRGAEQGILHKMIIENGIQEWIDVIGPVPHDKLPLLFNRFDAFVFPTFLNESLGLVGVEALACGIPVIGNNIAGIPGYVRDGYNGFLYDSTCEDLEKKVLKYNSLSQLEKKRMSQNARQSAQQYDTKRVMRQLFEELRF